MFYNKLRSQFLICLSVLLVHSAWAAPRWKRIHTESGIVVSERKSTLGDLPDFKAKSRVNASLMDLIAVLQDVNRRTEWVHRCTASSMVQKTGEFEILLYHRTDAPWPVSDRDSAIQTQLFEIVENRQYLAYFKGVVDPRIPARSDAVRLPHIEGYYLLKYVGPEETSVTYFVHLDPGGYLPHWLVRRATRDLPTKTIIGLRKQIRATKNAGTYRSFLERWDPRFRPADAPLPPRPPRPSDGLLDRLGL